MLTRDDDKMMSFEVGLANLHNFFFTKDNLRSYRHKVIGQAYLDMCDLYNFYLVSIITKSSRMSLLCVKA